MIHIDIDNTPLDPSNIKNIKTCQEKLNTHSNPANYMKSSQWNKHCREYLEKLSHGKCWYSELKTQGAYTLEIDHFRPKNFDSRNGLNKNHKKLKEKYNLNILSAGYLNHVYDWRNYRLLAPKFNKAKGHFFPLFNNPNATNITLENHVFLDPTDINDICLIQFNASGEMCPSTELGNNHIRAVVTIEVYDLNNDRTVSARKELYEGINRALGNRSNANDLVQLLKQYTDPSAQCSAFITQIILQRLKLSII